MSASREKKQRQSDLGNGLTQRQIKEQEEAATAKRKRTIYTIAAAVIVVLVAALLVWDTGFIQGRAAAVTLNGHTYYPADVEYYYRNYLQQEVTMSQYGMSSYDMNISAKSQILNEESGQTYHDYFMEQALKDLTQATAIEDAAAQDGFTLSQEGLQAVESTLAQLDAGLPSGYTRATYLKAVYGKYMTVAHYRACLERAQLVNEYYTAHKDSLSFDEAGIQAYYEEHKNDLDTFVFSVCFISGKPATATDDAGNTVEPTEEEKAAAMAMAEAAAQDMAAQVRDGADFDELAAQLAEEDDRYRPTKENSVLGNSPSIGTLYKDWLQDSARRDGDVEVLQSEGTGYYVVRFAGRYLDETPTVDVRHVLIKAEVPADDPNTPDVDESLASIPTHEAMDDAKTMAQWVMDEFTAGDQTPEAFGELAKLHSQDPGSNTNGGLYEQVYDGRMFEAFNDWIMDPARQPGDLTLIENTQDGQRGWHVVYFQAKNDPVWAISSRNSLITDAMERWMESLTEGYTAVQVSGIKYVG